MCLGSEVGELLAEYRWVAPGSVAALATQHSAESRIAQELGGVGIAWLLLCDRLGVNPVQVVKDKIEINRAKYPVEVSRGRAERP
jgi:dCTP diphosphatase